MPPLASPAPASLIDPEADYRRRLWLRCQARLIGEDDQAAVGFAVSAQFDAQSLLDSLNHQPDDQLRQWILDGGREHARGRETLTSRLPEMLDFIQCRFVMHLISQGWACPEASDFPLTLSEEEGPQGGTINCEVFWPGANLLNPAERAAASERLKNDLNSFLEARGIFAHTLATLPLPRDALDTGCSLTRTVHDRCFAPFRAERERLDLEEALASTRAAPRPVKTPL